MSYSAGEDGWAEKGRRLDLTAARMAMMSRIIVNSTHTDIMTSVIDSILVWLP